MSLTDEQKKALKELKARRHSGLYAHKGGAYELASHILDALLKEDDSDAAPTPK